MECKYYIQYSHLYNKPRLKENEIIERIKRLDKEKSLKLLSYWMNLVDNFSLDANYILNCLKHYYMLDLTLNDKSFNKFYFNNGSIFEFQLLLFAFKWVLFYGSSNKCGEPNKNLANELIEVLIALADYLPQDEVADCPIEFIWSTLHLHTMKVPKFELARAYKIYCLNNKFNNKYNNDFIASYGISIEEYLKIMFRFINGIFDTNLFSDWISIDCLDNRTKNFLINFAKPYETFKQLPIEVVKNSWQYDIFFKNPIVIENNFVHPIAGRIICSNFFEYLFFKIKLTSNNKEFYQEFGVVFENYVQELTENTCHNNLQYINEFEYDAKKSSDCYIWSDKTLFIIEAKSKAPKDETYLMKNKEQIEEAVQKLAIEPICQADRFYQYIVNDNRSNSFKEMDKSIEEIFVISVSMEKIQPISQLYLDIKKKFNKDTKYFIKGNKKEFSTKLKTKKIKVGINLNIYDYEKLCAIIENKGIDIAKDILMQSYNNAEPLDNIIINENLSDLKSSFVEKNFELFTVLYK